ncbi:MAG: hypothetical protein BroJett018_49680 [Chloroflexota bacterium]|nr:MAG: hypothetical protein BroJett018_49680 [Chloroflexota bacterium]
MVQLTLTIPDDLAQEAQEFGVLGPETILSLVRAETDRRIMEFVNAEIHAYRQEKRAAESASDQNDPRRS